MRIVSIVMLLSVVGCALAPPQPAFQGSPSVEVRGITAEQVAARFSTNCLDGGRVVQASPYHVTCAMPMDGSAGAMVYRALLTERYASNPEIMTQTAWVKTQSGLKVTAAMWVEHQNAFGKVTRNDLTDDSTKHRIQAGLNNFKHNVEGSRP